MIWITLTLTHTRTHTHTHTYTPIHAALNYHNNVYTDHIAFLRISDHALEFVAYALLGEAAGEFLAGASLAAVEDDEATTGRLELLDERILGRRCCGVRRRSVDGR